MKVLVAMSGGIDSAASALILKEAGYEVIGCILRMHEHSEIGIKDAISVANSIGIELIVVDVSEDFAKIVKNYFCREYLSGRTPNPCILCNKYVKFRYLFRVADERNIELVATGHYAKSVFDSEAGRYLLVTAEDKSKDQSYVLWGLNQDILSRIIFPLGGYDSKKVVRDLVESQNVPIFSKEDSQDLCFVPSGDYNSFIEGYLSSVGVDNSFIKPGDIMIDGRIIGSHRGISYYTVGQRRGLGVSYKVPVYVKRIDVANNVIEVATLSGTYSNGLISEDFNIIKYDNYLPEIEYTAKIRYKDGGKLSKARIEGGKLVVTFKEPCSSVALGQSVVLYEDDILVGGGVISGTF